MKELKKEYLKRPYKQDVVVINKDNISRFVRPKWHRDFREPHIKEIMNGLLGGNHFNEVVTTNYNGKDYEIINGNHRMEAVRRILELHPKFSIQVTVAAYSELTPDEQKDLYSIINNVKNESMDDFVKAHCYDSKIYKLMTKGTFPCNVGFYSTKAANLNYIPFTTLMKSYMSRHETKQLIMMFRKDELVEEIRKLDEKDYDRISEFVRFFRETFGDPSSTNKYANYHKLLIIAKIYYIETEMGIGRDNLQKRFEYAKMKYPSEFDGRVQNLAEQKLFYSRIVMILNEIKKFDRGEVQNIFSLTKAEPVEEKPVVNFKYQR